MQIPTRLFMVFNLTSTDLSNIQWITGILATIITAFLTVNYIQSENNRVKYNDDIKLLFEEIDSNRKKLPKFKDYLDDIQKEWEDYQRINWINHADISIGYGNYLYNFLKFDIYNFFMINGQNRHLSPEFDYSLKQFYHKCKEFCAKTQFYEESIRKHIKMGNYDSIKKEFKNIANEYKLILEWFERSPHFNLENMNKHQFSRMEWHIWRERKEEISHKNEPPITQSSNKNEFELLTEILDFLRDSQKENEKTNRYLISYMIVATLIAIITAFVAYSQILSDQKIPINLTELGYLLITTMVIFLFVLVMNNIIIPIWEFLKERRN